MARIPHMASKSKYYYECLYKNQKENSGYFILLYFVSFKGGTIKFHRNHRLIITYFINSLLLNQYPRLRSNV